LTPLFQGEDGKLVEGGQNYVIHTAPNNMVVVQVPTDACTVEMAQRTERELMDKLQRDVIVTSDNVKFMKVEPVDRAEIAELLKADNGEGAMKEAMRESPTPPQGTPAVPK
jgi:hypothetical protein